MPHIIVNSLSTRFRLSFRDIVTLSPSHSVCTLIVIFAGVGSGSCQSTHTHRRAVRNRTTQGSEERCMHTSGTFHRCIVARRLARAMERSGPPLKISSSASMLRELSLGGIHISARKHDLGEDGRDIRTRSSASWSRLKGG